MLFPAPHSHRPTTIAQRSANPTQTRLPRNPPTPEPPPADRTPLRRGRPAPTLAYRTWPPAPGKTAPPHHDPPDQPAVRPCPRHRPRTDPSPHARAPSRRACPGQSAPQHHATRPPPHRAPTSARIPEKWGDPAPGPPPPDPLPAPVPQRCSPHPRHERDPAAPSWSPHSQRDSGSRLPSRDPGLRHLSHLRHPTQNRPTTPQPPTHRPRPRPHRCSGLPAGSAGPPADPTQSTPSHRPTGYSASTRRSRNPKRHRQDHSFHF